MTRAQEKLIMVCSRKNPDKHLKERVVPEQRNKKILDGVRAATFKPLIECLKSIDQDLLKGAVAGAKFSELFFASCKDEELAAYVKTLL